MNKRGPRGDPKRENQQISKKDLSILTDIGAFNPYLDHEEIWLIYAKLGLYHGWAIIGAKSKNSAKYYIKKPITGWIREAKIIHILPLKNSFAANKEEELKKDNNFPTEYGQWFELKWGPFYNK
jgi:hypothetical protein